MDNHNHYDDTFHIRSMADQMPCFIAYDEDCDFPIENLPYGVYSTFATKPHVCTAIGSYILDLAQIYDAGFFDGILQENCFAVPTLNDFMALGKSIWVSVRARLQSLLTKSNHDLQDNDSLRQAAFIQMDAVTMHMPVEVKEFTDFYSSKYHAFNVGSMFRGPENALMENWLHLPVGYHGRASSVILSGTSIHRPQGQLKGPNDLQPYFGPSKRLDFELEMGTLVGIGNDLGQAVAIHDAPDHLFGFILLNDWSARDIQVWEYRPLGPFLAKNFATSVSPWVIPMEALEPFRIPGPEQDPKVLPYLQSEGDWNYDIELEVQLQSESMEEPLTISKSNFKHLYWNVCQQLAHHTITGCNMRTGDLFGSGTISGPTEDSYGSMLELTWNGKSPLQLPDGSTRVFLEDGDTVIMKGYCKNGKYRLGFGEVRTKILSSV